MTCLQQLLLGSTYVSQKQLCEIAMFGSKMWCFFANTPPILVKFHQKHLQLRSCQQQQNVEKHDHSHIICWFCDAIGKLTRISSKHTSDFRKHLVGFAKNVKHEMSCSQPICFGSTYVSQKQSCEIAMFGSKMSCFSQTHHQYLLKFIKNTSRCAPASNSKTLKNVTNRA